MAAKKVSHAYGAAEIQVLEGLEPVRKRPGMYIGSTGPDGLHHMAVEIIDNGRDEAMAGHATVVEITLLPDNIVRVVDNGRGIPTDIHKKTKVSALETVMTTLHAGGKFEGEGYKIAGGLHGVGASVVNALSEWLVALVHHEGGVFFQEYAIGKRKSAVKKIGPSKKTGTIITFKADTSIMTTEPYDYRRIVNHVREQSYLTKGLRMRVVDARETNTPIDLKKVNSVFWFTELGIQAPSQSFYFDGGLLSLIKFYNLTEKPINKNIFYVDKEHSDISVEIALQYVDDIATREVSFANNTTTPEGGTHITGFRTVLTRSLNSYAKKNVAQKDAEAFTAEDVREGMVAVVSIKMRDAQFEGQTKSKLGSVEARGAVESVFNEALNSFLEEHPDDARAIIQKITLAMRARKAAKAAKDTILRKGALEGMTLPGKLADCQTRKAEDSELFIVEGDSAGGCFSGDTKVALADGRDLSFKELIVEDEQGKQNFCYSIDGENNVVITPIMHPRITKKDAEVIEIMLDTNEKITCTPDHRFMLRDGSFKDAKDLTTNDSLMPLNKKLSEKGGRITISGYEMVMNPQDSYNQTYLRKALSLMHGVYRSEGSINVDTYNAVRKEKQDRSIIRFDTICERFFSGNEEALKQAVANFNHRILRVKKLSQKIDVYDIEVPGTHNFALASGVFVHNSSKMGRDRRTQAILPLKGKILNVEKARLDKMLSSEEVKNLVIALGTAIGDTFDISRLRYHKVIIATDADVDGAHIRTLLLTLFYRYFRELIDKGYIYIAQPPLYKIQKGKSITYAYTEAEKNKIVGTGVLQEGEDESEDEDAETTTKKAPSFRIQRYKGLGEMNPDELRETTMNPAHRILKQVTVEDAESADQTFSILMGSDVAPRKLFIQTNAKLATVDA
ncbi:MAG: ATP-binding protein [bacterium]|nr:ATP-binding protein [bacterium]